MPSDDWIVKSFRIPTPDDIEGTLDLGLYIFSNLYFLCLQPTGHSDYSTATFQPNSDQILAKFQSNSNQIPTKFQLNSNWIPTKFQPISNWIPIEFQPNSNEIATEF